MFDGSGITDIESGAGKVRANHAASPTVLFVCKTDAKGGDIAARLATLGASTNAVKGQMRFRSSDGGTPSWTMMSPASPMMLAMLNWR